MLKNACLVLLSLMISVAHTNAQSKSPADYVNPFIGASTSADAAGIYHGLGKTFPGAATPFGMVQVSPNTITGGDNGSGYSYEHRFIEGFAFTQMSGIGWYGDLGNFLVTPGAGVIKTFAGRHKELPDGYRTSYDKSSEKASAGYYAVKLTNNILCEAAAAPHSGILRFTFPKDNASHIQVDMARRVGGTAIEEYIKLTDSVTIQGWMKCTADGGGWGNGDGHPDYTVYFYAQFSKPLKDYGAWSADIPADWSRKREAIESLRYDSLISKAAIINNFTELHGKHLGFFTRFATSDNEPVLLKTGISFTGMEAAKQNLEAEISGWDFEQVRTNTVNRWNEALSKISVEGGTEEQKTIFYTALYHTMIDPRNLMDVKGTYVGGDRQVHSSPGFVKRGIFSGWDVFRSQFPLQTIINPGVVSDMINSLVTLADESGKQYLERWEFLNAYSGCMIGSPAVVVINDAWNKGIRNFDVDKAYRYSKNTLEKFGNGERGHSFDISNTLENGFAEWSLSRLATGLQHPQDAALYSKRAASYKNIFDAKHGWFNNKNRQGDWEPWPEEGRIKIPALESNAYQQGWFVPHDLDGLVKLIGGRDKTINDLVDFFEKTPSDFSWNDYYNHANEPVHHVPFLFNRLAVPWLTQKWSRIICTNAYHNSVEGLVGNEDVGQMSAWYVLASSGIHMVCPGDNRYEITSPLFSKVVMHLPDADGKQKQFVIIAKNNSPQNIYIQSASLNGKPYHKCYLNYRDIAAGSTLVLTMGGQPNKQWGLIK